MIMSEKLILISCHLRHLLGCSPAFHVSDIILCALPDTHGATHWTEAIQLSILSQNVC